MVGNEREVHFMRLKKRKIMYISLLMEIDMNYSKVNIVGTMLMSQERSITLLLKEREHG